MDINSGWVVAGVAVAAQAAVVIKWLYGRIRNDELNRAFVEAMATSHLPFIYHSLEKIATEKDVKLGERPEIAFLKFNGNGKKPWQTMT
jgi:hypothetical protein